MKIGWVGLGKLGLPCAAVLAEHHEVLGYDVDPERVRKSISEPVYWEQNLGNQLALVEDSLTVLDTPHRLGEAEVIFLAVQTPHQPELDGTRPYKQGADFGYEHLMAALTMVSEHAAPGVPVCVISTVAPGTTQRLGLAQFLPDNPYVYMPAFIAMGTTIRDYQWPELRVVGVDPETMGDGGMGVIYDTFAPLDGPPGPRSGQTRIVAMRIPDAEAVKMLYNTWIGLKIGFANTVAQIADGVGADSDWVMWCLSQATERVNSWRYMQPGMGDGGACHPRDQLVLAHLADQNFQVDLRLRGRDLFTATIEAREQHAYWLANELWKHRIWSDRPTVILGYAYKPNTGLDFGSPAHLVAHFIKRWANGLELIDADMGDDEFLTEPRDIFIGTAHDRYRERAFLPGSVVLDPFGIISQELNREVEIIRPGRRPGQPQWSSLASR